MALSSHARYQFPGCQQREAVTFVTRSKPCHSTDRCSCRDVQEHHLIASAPWLLGQDQDGIDKFTAVELHSWPACTRVVRRMEPPCSLSHHPPEASESHARTNQPSGDRTSCPVAFAAGHVLDRDSPGLRDNHLDQSSPASLDVGRDTPCPSPERHAQKTYGSAALRISAEAEPPFRLKLNATFAGS